MTSIELGPARRGLLEFGAARGLAGPAAPRPLARTTSWLLVAALGGLLAVRALELRVPQMTRPFWEDEIHHNEPVLSSASTWQLRHRGSFHMMYQPLLDFWTRKAFWFPVLGVDERALRMPALVWGAATVLLVYALALATLASRTSLRWAALLAFCVAIWIVDNPAQIHYSAEARHYALVAFASTLWFGLLLLHDGRPRVLFALATLLFANTHFFALPMIAGGYAVLILRERRARPPRPVGLHVAVLLGVAASTLLVNRGPFLALLRRTPTAIGVAEGPLAHPLGVPILRAALGVWLDYGTFLALPLAAWALWLAMLAIAALRGDRRWAPFFLAVFAVLPAFFVYVRLRSDYPFRTPYFSPFLGLGLVTLIGALGFALDGWEWLARRLSWPGRAVLASAGLAALAAAVGLPAFARGLVAERGGIHRVERNFSPYFLAYRELASEGKPVFVLHSHCWADDIPDMYLTHILRMDTVFHAAADALGCETPIPVVRERLSSFLRDQGPAGGYVVLDQKEESCRGRPVPPVDFPGTVERVSAVQDCMWKVRGATSLEDLGRAAASVGFHTAPGFF